MILSVGLHNRGHTRARIYLLIAQVFDGYYTLVGGIDIILTREDVHLLEVLSFRSVT